ncbi:phospholipase SGR2 isoform X2 [Prosopis cineraria]|uniref:phospholipase SGR2 isoform X2 n=1 Tax=Prosopis cineraria TaxID=364024 RepID=UPI0024108D50|nr:phospholipase SGR2 isoform X2 [Prosopis cineraria]
MVESEDPNRAVDEISPDLLKNTPSNIARLEDVIEHSKARQKYLAQTASPSDGGDVRWYFCKVPLADNVLSASIPRTEIVGKSDYFRFGMRDSLAIEASFLEREEELLSSWWREYAECSIGPTERQSSDSKTDKHCHGSSKGIDWPSELYEIEEERVGVPVKGGLYEVDLVKRHCFPVYWNGENRRVLRGHWFARKGGLDWLPLREDVAEQLEVAYRSQVWHRRTFQPSGLFAARVDLQGSIPGLHALFTGEDGTWEAWLNVDSSGFSNIASLTGNGIKLRRGYSPSSSPKPTQDELRQRKEEEMDDYCSQVPVQHLVFMVHGIGQRLEKSNLVDDVANFRHITESLAEQHLTAHQRGTQRVLFIPCQWRKGLKLSGESAVEKITLDGVRGLRVMLSATVHDVLYYMSPIYCQDIIDSVSTQLNRLYLKFLKRNPGYEGKVSIYGHSLGSVLSYDILCHQENLASPCPMDSMHKEHYKHENPLLTVKDHCSGIYSSSLQNDTLSMASLSNETMTAKPGPSELGAENTGDSLLLCPALPSVHKYALEHNSQKPEHERDVHDFLSDFSKAPHEKNDAIFKPGNMNARIPADGLERLTTDEHENTSNKDEVIRMLREEVASLKGKLVELESHCGSQRSKEDRSSDKRLSEKLLSAEDAPKSYTPYIKYTKLQFKVDTFFAVGSPLGVFLALRNIRIGIGRGQEYWGEENIIEQMPACRQMFNIFHPYDPVAYRVDPLVCKEYISKRPVLVPYHRGGRRLHIGFQEFTEDLAVRTQAIMNHLKSARVKILTVCQSKTSESIEDVAGDNSEEEEETYGSLTMERLTGSKEGHIDHMLQDKTFEHPYLQAIGSHTNYWRDHDTALFILKHLYRDIPEEPNSSVKSSNGKKNEAGSAGWIDPREKVEEELPLTFADNTMVRNFSRKAKKVLN